MASSVSEFWNPENCVSYIALPTLVAVRLCIGFGSLIPSATLLYLYSLASRGVVHNMNHSVQPVKQEIVMVTTPLAGRRKKNTPPLD